MSALQKFVLQLVEDGENPSAKWGAYLPIPATEVEDPDDEDNIPIPAATTSASGKPQARASIRDWSDDEDDDCQILEPIDAPPLSFAYPLPSDPVNPVGQGPKSRKHAWNGPSDAETPTALDPAVLRTRKMQKKAANRGHGKKALPVTVG